MRGNWERPTDRGCVCSAALPCPSNPTHSTRYVKWTRPTAFLAAFCGGTRVLGFVPGARAASACRKVAAARWRDSNRYADTRVEPTATLRVVT